MKEDSNKNNLSENFYIPTDVIIEITQIILQADLPHEIISVKENKAQIELSIFYQKENQVHKQALQNIQKILQDYHTMLCEEEDETDWRV